ncbi:MAG: hypothetical protein AB7K24_31470 [Gemmataceae bacterium]
MSKIVILVDSYRDKLNLAWRIRQSTGLGLAAINQRLESKLPVLEEVLFHNNHDEVAAKLREFVQGVSAEMATLRIFEVGEDEEFATCPQDRREIPSETLFNILAEHDERMGD